MRALAFAAFVLFGVFAAGPVRAADPLALEIVGKTGVHPFAVEVVSNEADRAKGLMYRKSLPEGQGMLFDFHSEQDVSFWMQNTYIPLDMIFIKADGTISTIAENTIPYSETPVPSSEPVRAVIEIKGGGARQLGIAAGAKVHAKIFNNAL